MAEPDTCHCPQLAIGLEVLETRNWNPNCPLHGTESEWWNSDTEKAKRATARLDLIARQEEAKIARRSRGA